MEALSRVEAELESSLSRRINPQRACGRVRAGPPFRSHVLPHTTAHPQAVRMQGPGERAQFTPGRPRAVRNGEGVLPLVAVHQAKYLTAPGLDLPPLCFRRATDVADLVLETLRITGGVCERE